MFKHKEKTNRLFTTFISLIGFLIFSNTAHAFDIFNQLAVDLVRGDFSIMVLGSGGPAALSNRDGGSGRANSSYLIFIDGKPKILMDAGGGAYKNLAESGVNIKDLDLVLLTHLHLDHTGDLPSIIKTMYFQNSIYNINNQTFPPGRTQAIRIFGPAANGILFPAALGADKSTTQYSSTSTYIDGHYDLNRGHERYLHIFTRATSAGIFNYNTTDILPKWTSYEPDIIVNENGLVITAVGVNHGPVPNVAYRIEYKGKSIVYSGDTSSRKVDPKGNPLVNGGNMVSISDNADWLIYDAGLGTDIPPSPEFEFFYKLHTTPSRVGEVAAAANVKQLMLSHITLQSENEIPNMKQLIRKQGFVGFIEATQDLKVYNLLAP